MSDPNASRRTLLKAVGGLAGVTVVGGTGLAIAGNGGSSQSDPELEWLHYYEDKEGEYDLSADFSGLVQAANGGYAIAVDGHSISGGEKSERLFSVVRADSVGEHSSTSFVDDEIEGTDQGTRDSVKTENNGMLIVGSAKPPDENRVGEAIKLDQDDNKEWVTTISPAENNPNVNFDGSQRTVIRHVEHAHDTGYVLAGFSGGYEWLAKLTEGGDIDWQRHYDHHGGHHLAYVRGIDRVENGGYVYISGKYVVKVDSQGHEEWVTDHSRRSHVRVARALTEMQDGRIAVTGEDSDNTVKLVMLAADGEILWDKAYEAPYSGDCTCRSTQAISQEDGGLLLGGAMNDEDGTRRYSLVKTDSEGNEEWTFLFGEANRHLISEHLQPDADTLILSLASLTHRDRTTEESPPGLAKITLPEPEPTPTPTDTTTNTPTETQTNTATATETDTETETATPTPAEETETDKDCEL